MTPGDYYFLLWIITKWRNFFGCKLDRAAKELMKNER